MTVWAVTSHIHGKSSDLEQRGRLTEGAWYSSRLFGFAVAL